MTGATRVWPRSRGDAFGGDGHDDVVLAQGRVGAVLFGAAGGHDDGVVAVRQRGGDLGPGQVLEAEGGQGDVRLRRGGEEEGCEERAVGSKARVMAGSRSRTCGGSMAAAGGASDHHLLGRGQRRCRGSRGRPGRCPIAGGSGRPGRRRGRAAMWPLLALAKASTLSFGPRDPAGGGELRRLEADGQAVFELDPAGQHVELQRRRRRRRSSPSRSSA